MGNIILSILYLAVFCTAPALVLWICKKVPLLGKLGPIMILYVLGMIIGNLPIEKGNIAMIQELLPNILIPLAIPMMLYSSTFSTRQLTLQMKVALSGFLSVAVAVAIGYVLFGSRLEEGAQIGGIILGMYTGGTLNAAALQTVFRIKGETFVLINSYDIIISFLYLVFILTVGIKWSRKLYGESDEKRSNGVNDNVGKTDITATEINYRKILSKEGIKQLCRLLALTILVAAVSAAVALMFPNNWFMVIFILMISTLGVACSFIPSVKKLEMSYGLGMYLIYIFSITIASMANFSNLNIASGAGLFGYLAVGVFVSLALHAIFCRILKVDADSMVISSVAFINSPPFVPMISASMKNKEALLIGLAAGIIGYAAGNHMGILIGWLLEFVGKVVF